MSDSGVNFTSDGERMAFCLLAVPFCLACWIVPSYFEAQAFNRATGKSVSTWDAMFLDLRVSDAPK